MAVSRIVGSDATVARMLTAATLSNQKFVDDATVKDVIDDFAFYGLQNGETSKILDDITVKAIDNLRKTNDAMQIIAPQYKKDKKDRKDKNKKDEDKDEGDFEAERSALLRHIEKAQQTSTAEEKEYVARLQKAPNPEEYRRNFPQPIAVIEQRSTELRKKATELLTAIKHAQQKTEDDYRIAYTNIHGITPPAIQKAHIPDISSSEPTRSRRRR